MDAKAKRARDTRWLYRLEDTALSFNELANEDRPIGYLRELARRVWNVEAPNRTIPHIVAGSRMRYSYCCGNNIVLARHHRTILVLLHELTHALGPCVHGPRFIRLYFRLLHKWAGYNRWFLQQIAAERGILI